MSADRMDLGGNWNLIREKDGSSRPMAVPGDIMSALLAAGEIPDPYEGLNELELQWIGREDWRIEREFELSPSALSFARIQLEALVLDTVAEVSVNGRLLGTSRNMFRRFRADMKDLLKAGGNRISVRILSPERAAIEAAQALPYPIPASEYPICSPHRNLLRKAQCMAGWDWGPCLMTGGIYEGIHLVFHDGPAISSVRTRMRRAFSGWDATVLVGLEAGEPGHCALVGRLAGAEARLELDCPAGASVHELGFHVEDVEDWNPAGCGSQTLYGLEVEVELSGAAGAGGSGVAADSGAAAGSGKGRGARLSRRLGFRELEVRAKEDEWGKSLVFVVNGRDLFAKGANWIPADALPSRWTRERLADLLGSAVRANMNMLRVWGGGRFESDAFYELCDELGILVWQDCMFSCALYPSSKDFLAEVEAEIRDVVGRLADHPSIALWCGNNEALGAITWYEESRKSPARYVADYDRLTQGTLARLFAELDPDRMFWPSSPSAGPDDYSDNWHSDGRGDMHYWTVWHEGKDFSAYLGVRPRFCSEFGYQSLPSERIAASFSGPGDRNVTSPVFEHHQRHPRGNTIIIENMLRYFRMPSGFAKTLYLSQVQQALAIRTAVEFWRSLRPRCMGSLYWQLNDVWPVASWSSLEYDGGWKILHHEARRFYEPLHLALIVKDGEVEAHAMNDSLTGFDARLEVLLRSFKDGAVIARYQGGATADAATLAADSATLLWRKPLAELGAAPAEAYLDARLFLSPRTGAPRTGVYQTGATQAVTMERRASAFLTEPKRCTLPDAGLSGEVLEDGAGLSVRVRAERPAFWVALDLLPDSGLEGSFADSGFDLGPGEERTIGFLPTRGKALPKAAELGKALRLMDLASSSS